jgi:hypothetical protein
MKKKNLAILISTGALLFLNDQFFKEYEFYRGIIKANEIALENIKKHNNYLSNTTYVSSNSIFKLHSKHLD